MIFFSLMVAARLASASVPLDSNLLANPGFETGLGAWSLWARSPDSGEVVAATDCRTGAGCAEIRHQGGRDWAYSPGTGDVEARPGELWRFQAWIRGTDLAAGSAELGFVTLDSAGETLDWIASPARIQASATWTLVVARLTIPKSARGLRPRITGYGPSTLAIDDAFFGREADPPAATDLVLENDSLHLDVDPLDLSMKLVDRGATDTLALGGLTLFRTDSARKTGDSLTLHVRHVSDSWPARIHLRLAGGALRLALDADSAVAIPDEFRFPGAIPTRTGQRIALPRGTGLAWPVDGPLSTRWSLKSAPFWEWQVAQSLTGATDGKTGFVLSVGEPGDAKVVLTKTGDQPSRPEIWQLPSKGVFGHPRSATVAPLRGGGFAELARRHRAFLEERGRVLDWTRKVARNPDVDKLRGAMDWWMHGSGFGWKSFDTLRWMGMDKAVIHWYGSSRAPIDSLVARGWLVSVYDDWSDTYPDDTSLLGREYTDGAIVEEGGGYKNGWLEIRDDGTTRQAREICAARHPALARAQMTAERAATARNARFVDVELAMDAQECWSAEHPTDRQTDFAHRHRALSIVKDTFSTVTGSEQTRDLFHDVVDYGEGPMSIASTANAGYDWATPVPPESTMDSLSMDPALRIPLLPLTDHDAFAPTWYTGDGQSKVPARWDDKDAWNLLYGTMPLLMPVDRKMWDSLQPRYLRTINAVGPFLARCQFSSMTDWEPVSSDRKVQRTRFGCGWTVVANFDDAHRIEAGSSLPAKGYAATGSGERIERTLLDGAVRTRARLADRWFLDPEGVPAQLDGVRTSGSLLMVREDDTTTSLAFLGNQTAVDLLPAALPWPATRLRAETRAGQAVALSEAGNGWLSLARGDRGRFFRLRGDFGTFSTSLAPISRIGTARALIRPASWELAWNQTEPATARIELFDARGRVLHRATVAGGAGPNTHLLPATAGVAWIRLAVPGATRTLPVVR